MEWHSIQEVFIADGYTFKISERTKLGHLVVPQDTPEDFYFTGPFVEIVIDGDQMTLEYRKQYGSIRVYKGPFGSLCLEVIPVRQNLWNRVYCKIIKKKWILEWQKCI